jgi:hypothetical protein
MDASAREMPTGYTCRIVRGMPPWPSSWRPTYTVACQSRALLTLCQGARCPAAGSPPGQTPALCPAEGGLAATAGLTAGAVQPLLPHSCALPNAPVWVAAAAAAGAALYAQLGPVLPMWKGTRAASPVAHIPTRASQPDGQPHWGQMGGRGEVPVLRRHQGNSHQASMVRMVDMPALYCHVEQMRTIYNL